MRQLAFTAACEEQQAKNEATISHFVPRCGPPEYPMSSSIVLWQRRMMTCGARHSKKCCVLESSPASLSATGLRFQVHASVAHPPATWMKISGIDRDFAQSRKLNLRPISGCCMTSHRLFN